MRSLYDPVESVPGREAGDLAKPSEGDRIAPLVWIIIASVLLLLVVVAAMTLSADYMRGAFGGNMTLARAKKVLVVSTDDDTRERAAAWMGRHRAEYPHATSVALHITNQPDARTFELFEEALKRERPDAVVWALHDEQHGSHEGPYAMAKEQLNVPMDAIYTSGETTAQKERQGGGDAAKTRIAS